MYVPRWMQSKRPRFSLAFHRTTCGSRWMIELEGAKEDPNPNPSLKLLQRFPRAWATPLSPQLSPKIPLLRFLAAFVFWVAVSSCPCSSPPAALHSPGNNRPSSSSSSPQSFCRIGLISRRVEGSASPTTKRLQISFTASGELIWIRRKLAA